MKKHIERSAIDRYAERREVTVKEATASYEKWIRRCTAVISSDLLSNNEQMEDYPFLFLRGTLCKWAQQWPSICADLCNGSQVLAIGALHLNSCGTWRDAQGRLCWGIDDFDESYWLPYRNDLVRLAASMKIVCDAGGLSIKVKAGCDAILERYVESLKGDGRLIVLAEREQKLGRLGIDSFKPPTNFWEKLNGLQAVRPVLAPEVKQALEKTFPDPQMSYSVVRRQAGLGSVGQQRFVAIGEWQGGCVVREANPMLPSGCMWLRGERGHSQSNYEKAIKSAVRSPHPFQMIQGSWVKPWPWPPRPPTEEPHH
jgi:hypothetical protein